MRGSSALGDHGSFLSRKSCIMGDLVFLRRSDEYRHAAAVALRNARATPPGAERNRARVLARGLMDLARTEAWLEGQRFQTRRMPLRIASSNIS
jgi:hypothetical protein